MPYTMAMTSRASESRTESNEGSLSTTWVWKRVKITRAAQPRETAPRKGHRWRGRTRREPAEWLTLRMKYGGGSEGWVIVDARGVVAPFHGATAILDILMEVCQAR